MKFAHQIAEAKEADRSALAGQYIDYKRLKKIIFRKVAMPERFREEARRNMQGRDAGVGSVREEGKGERSREDIEREIESEAWRACFFSELENELEKATRAVTGPLRWVMHRAEMLESGWKVAVQGVVERIRHKKHGDGLLCCEEEKREGSSQSQSLYGGAAGGRLRLTKAEREVYRDAWWVYSFAVVNATAVRKIGKKWDKVVGGTEGREWVRRARDARNLVMEAGRMRALEALAERGAMLCGRVVTTDDGSSRTRHIGSAAVADSPRCCGSSTQEEEATNRSDAFACGVCLEVMFRPTRMRCGHALCVVCYDRLCAKVDARCPMCRTVGVEEHASVDKALDRFIAAVYRDEWRERRAEWKARRAEMVRKNVEYIYKFDM